MGALPPWPPYQGFALDPLGALSGPLTPRPIILHPPFLIPGYGSVYYYLPMGITLCQKEKAHGSYLSPEKSPSNKQNYENKCRLDESRYYLLGKWCGHSFENILSPFTHGCFVPSLETWS